MRKADPCTALGAALIRARALAEAFGYTVPYVCPMVWGSESFTMFLPPPKGVVDESFLNWGSTSNTVKWTRGEATQRLYPQWPSFYQMPHTFTNLWAQSST